VKAKSQPSLLLVLLFFYTLLFKSAKAFEPEPSRNDHVVLISVDGMLPAYYLEAPKYGLRIPTLQSLMGRGSLAEAMEGVCPTVTYPSHTTMVTGVRPRRHGIVSNNIFDPFNKTYNAWYWYAEDIRAKPLWAAAREKQLITANSSWPATVGANIDYNFPEFWRARAEGDLKLLRVISTPGLVQSVEEKYGKFDPAVPSDKDRTHMAEFLIENYRPHLLLVHLAALDHVEHETGPFSQESFRTLEESDALIYRIIQASRQAGIYDQTDFLIVSDHGFIRTEQQVRPGILMKKAGLISTDTQGKVIDWRASFTVSGGIFMIRLKTPGDDSTLKEVQDLFENMPRQPNSGIGKVFRHEQIVDLGADPEGAYMLEAAPGFSFGSALDGEYLVPSPSLGNHGYLPSNPDQKASFIAAGRHIKEGIVLKEVRMVDIAPTLSQILTLNLPDTEGKVLSEILIP
jgi:predicted AlkP superfamily pyrophosphatase or phosphodiesterase